MKLTLHSKLITLLMAGFLLLNQILGIQINAQQNQPVYSESNYDILNPAKAYLADFYFSDTLPEGEEEIEFWIEYEGSLESQQFDLARGKFNPDGRTEAVMEHFPSSKRIRIRLLIPKTGEGTDLLGNLIFIGGFGIVDNIDI